MSHCSEETLKLTAAAHNITLTGKLEPCVDCATANARQKNVAKSTETKATQPGERKFIDITWISIKAMLEISFGYWHWMISLANHGVSS